MKKKYTLIRPQKSLAQIITDPDNPEAGMALYFDTCTGRTETIVSSNEIWKYVQASVYTETIGKDLALAIAKDYPQLFIRPLEFPSPEPVQSLDDPIFSHLSSDLKVYAEQSLKNMDEKIARAPGNQKLKIDRAESLSNSCEYLRAKIEYKALLPLFDEDSYYARKIKNGLENCDKELAKCGKVFQTPFCTEIEKTQHLNKAVTKSDTLVFTANKKLLFATSKTTDSTARSAEIENIALTNKLSLTFKESGELGISFRLMIDDVEQPGGMYIRKKSKDELIARQHDPKSLISLLKTWGESAASIAKLIENNLTVNANNAYPKIR